MLVVTHTLCHYAKYSTVGVSEMSYCVKTPAGKHNKWSLIPGVFTVEGED